MPDSSVSPVSSGTPSPAKRLLDCFTEFSRKTAVRLLLCLPFAVAVSISVTDVLAALICVFWLLGGNWKKRWTLVRNNPVLLASVPLIIITFAGIFRPPMSLPGTFLYWNGHYPLFYVIIFATLLDRKSVRYMLLSSINGAFLLTWCCAAYLTFYYADGYGVIPREFRAHSFQLFKNTICFGMALNLWILLWMYLPYTSRHIPLVRRSLPPFIFDAMRTAGQVSLLQLLFCGISGSKTRLNRTAFFLSLLRWGIIAFTTYYIFFPIGSRTAQLSLLVVYTVSLLLKVGRRGLAVAAVLSIVLLSGAYQFSERSRTKIDRGVSEMVQFSKLLAGRIGEKEYKKKVYERLGGYYFLIPFVWEKPVFGYGMEAGQTLVKTTIPFNDPHCEFLLIALQHGFVGLTAFLFWFFVLARQVFRLVPSWRAFGICFWLVLFIDCFFNCALSYHREAFFFLFLLGLLFLPKHRLCTTARLNFAPSNR